MTTTPTHLLLARGEIGVREATGRNDGLPSLRYQGGRCEAWCAHFLAWCFRMAGTPLPGDVVPTTTRRNPIALVATMEEELRRAGALLDAHEAPEPGDVMFFAARMLSDRSRGGRHVGLVDELGMTTVRNVEGNVPDVVRTVTYSRLRLPAIVTSYGRWPIRDVKAVVVGEQSATKR